MIGSLEVMYELTVTIPSVIQICSISSIRLSFNLGKPRLVMVNRSKTLSQLHTMNKPLNFSKPVAFPECVLHVGREQDFQR